MRWMFVFFCWFFRFRRRIRVDAGDGRVHVGRGYHHGFVPDEGSVRDFLQSEKLHRHVDKIRREHPARPTGGHLHGIRVHLSVNRAEGECSQTPYPVVSLSCTRGE